MNASFSHSVLITKHKQLTSSSLMKYSFEFLDIGCCSCLEQVQVCVSQCKLQQTIRFSDVIQIVLKWGCFKPEVSPRYCSMQVFPLLHKQCSGRCGSQTSPWSGPQACAGLVCLTFMGDWEERISVLFTNLCNPAADRDALPSNTQQIPVSSSLPQVCWEKEEKIG